MILLMMFLMNHQQEVFQPLFIIMFSEHYYSDNDSPDNFLNEFPESSPNGIFHVLKPVIIHCV